MAEAALELEQVQVPEAVASAAASVVAVVVAVEFVPPYESNWTWLQRSAHLT